MSRGPSAAVSAVRGSWVPTFEDVGHRVLGLFRQNRAQAGNELWGTKVDDQLPQTVTDPTNVVQKNRQKGRKRTRGPESLEKDAVVLAD